MSFIWIVWSTLYVYLCRKYKLSRNRNCHQFFCNFLKFKNVITNYFYRIMNEKLKGNENWCGRKNSRKWDSQSYAKTDIIFFHRGDIGKVRVGRKIGFSNFSCRFLNPNNFFQFELQLFWFFRCEKFPGIR